jgi:hypothetical protein
MKIHPVRATLFHVDGGTDTTKPIVDFRNFADVPKNATAAPSGYSGKRRSINVSNSDSIAGINAGLLKSTTLKVIPFSKP